MDSKVSSIISSKLISSIGYPRVVDGVVVVVVVVVVNGGSRKYSRASVHVTGGPSISANCSVEIPSFSEKLVQWRA